MSSHQLTDDRKDTTVDEAITASPTLPVNIPNSKNPGATTEHLDDRTAPSSRPSTARFTLDDTLSSSKQLLEGTAIEDDDHDDEIPYPEPESDSLLPPPDFKPFFTLIEDPTTVDHYHPTVHYLFADDDQEILTAAALETISNNQLQDPLERPEDERFVIVDMNADGREVVGISSLSPDWQTLKTKVTQAPSWGDESRTGDRGLMLRISGQEAEVGNEERKKDNIEGLLKTFDDLAGTLDEVLGLKTMDTDTQAVQ